MYDVIDKALSTHELIKKSMVETIRNDLTTDPQELRSDQYCAFGKWIYGRDGKVHKGRPEFEAMKVSHRQFHEAAYSAACLCRTGRRVEAERSILDGDFEMSSREFRQKLVSLKQAIRD